MFKKKGLEPLIASILLIVVAVILVTIVLAWGKNFSTEGLNKANGVLEDQCAGAMLAIPNCEINDSNKVVFQVKNIGTYDFSEDDDFQIMISNNSGVADAEASAEIYSPEWTGLTSGASAIATIDPTDTLTGIGASVNVNIRSSVCPQASVRYTNCNR